VKHVADQPVARVMGKGSFQSMQLMCVGSPSLAGKQAGVEGAACTSSHLLLCVILRMVMQQPTQAHHSSPAQ